MLRLLRGVVRLALLAALGYVVYRLISDSDDRAPAAGPRGADRSDNGSESPGGAPAPAERRVRAGTSPKGATRPPAAPSQPRPGSVRSVGVGEVPEHVPKWVEPAADGTCPTSHPVKAKLSSKIFHVPGGRHYDRTAADRCYRDADAAAADDLRPSKQ